MEDKELVNKNFDLEQGILRCWNVCEDIEDMVQVIQKNRTSIENIVKMLEGFCTVYQVRFERTFDIYEDVCRGLHQTRREREELAQRVQEFEEVTSTVAKKPQGKMAKSKRQKAVDQ
jgi:BMFP domain-containing protein YqiC